VVNPDRPLARELNALVRDALTTLPVVVVTGMRQAGKTTFLRNEPSLAGRRYLTLDDLATLEAAERQPEALLASADAITIDEVQRSPRLLLAVKAAVDRDRRPGRFLLSGSANLALLAGVTESLAGRAIYLTLRPMTRRERTNSVDKPPFITEILRTGQPPEPSSIKPVDDYDVLAGGLPPVALGQVARADLWYLGYEQTYLERDLRDLAQVADLVAFRTLLRLTALRTGQLLNVSELARDAKLAPSTATRYLGLLETGFLVERLPPHLGNPTSRLIKSPKIHFSDAGLAAHLAGVGPLSPESDEPLRGRLYETWVAQNLAGILGAHLPSAQLAYWNIQGRYEVDFVIRDRRRQLAIEVKTSSRFGGRDLAGLSAFVAQAEEPTVGVLAYGGSELLPLGRNLWAVPLGLLVA
jgi:uncharacterized protein